MRIKIILSLFDLHRVLTDGREVAIKRMKIGSRQGDNEFLNEVNLITRVQHKNLVRLLGCSIEISERMLVYKYLHNSSLDKVILGLLLLAISLPNIYLNPAIVRVCANGIFLTLLLSIMQ